MKKVTIITLLILFIFSGYTQNIDTSNKNITGFNRIQTGDGDWIDIQLLGVGSSFRVRDNTADKYFVKWDAGKSFTDFNQNVVISNGNLGIGTTDMSSKLNILHTASGYESLFSARVSDASSDYFKLVNGTGVQGRFIPILEGYTNSSNDVVVGLQAKTSSTKDKGTSPLLVFDARLENETVKNRPLFSWNNYGQSKMTMAANGNLGIGTTDMSSKLNILHTASGYESLFSARVSDASSDYFKLVNGTGVQGRFISILEGYTNSSNDVVMGLQAKTSSTKDKGTSPLLVFDARLENETVKNRPLFTWSNYGQSKMTMAANGNLGIGIPNPTSQLHLKDAIGGGFIKLTRGTGTAQLIMDNNQDRLYITTGTQSATQGLIIGDNGQVGIGTISTGSHKLAVEGSIGARRVKVESNGWSDFVFHDSYKLRDLEEVESYIAKNKHLPNVPSEAEVCEKGIDLGDMDATLLQKIEELTLYLIEQNKTLKKQNEVLLNQKEEMKFLKEEIAFLKKK